MTDPPLTKLINTKKNIWCNERYKSQSDIMDKFSKPSLSRRFVQLITETSAAVCGVGRRKDFISKIEWK